MKLTVSITTNNTILKRKLIFCSLQAVLFSVLCSTLARAQDTDEVKAVSAKPTPFYYASYYPGKGYLKVIYLLPLSCYQDTTQAIEDISQDTTIPMLIPTIDTLDTIPTTTTCCLPQ